MARITFDEAGKYSSSSIWFTLEDDGDRAEVMILLSKIEDLPIYAIHEVELNGTYAKIDCLRGPNDPSSVCPLCASGKKPSVKMLIPVLQNEQVKIWDRGKSFYGKIQRVFRKYKNVFAHTFEIERIGIKGDTNTQYEIDSIAEDRAVKSLKDITDALPDEEYNKLEIIGHAVRSWTEEDMYYYLETGKDPNDKGGNDKSKMTPKRGNSFVPRNNRDNVNSVVKRANSRDEDVEEEEDYIEEVKVVKRDRRVSENVEGDEEF